MKTSYIWVAVTSATLLFTTGCDKKKGDTWDDNNTSMGSYKRAGQRVLWGDTATATVEDTAQVEDLAFSSHSFSILIKIFRLNLIEYQIVL
jgi:hypothetical protein